MTTQNDAAGAGTGAPGAVNHWVRLSSGARYGPVSEEGLVEWARQGRVPADATIEADDGRPPAPAVGIPALRPYFVAPPIVGGTIARADGPDGDTAMGGLIPYRNGAALAGYYVGVFSLIPCLAVVLGPVAIVLGVVGLRAAARNPRVKGKAHAWVAIALGAVTLVANVVLILYFQSRP